MGYDYIRFDVDKIKEFVFESYKPVEVTGASEMIKLLDYDEDENEKGAILKELKENFPGTDIKVIFARGGGGLLRVNQDAEEICQWLKESYENRVTGGELTVVHCPDQNGDFQLTSALLNYKLREIKNQKGFFEPYFKPVQFSKTEEQRRCMACGKRAKKTISIKFGEEIVYCDACEKKRDHGEETIKEKDKEKQVFALEDLLKTSEKDTDYKFLLIIYGDLNEAGQLFASLKTEDELKDTSGKIYETLKQVRDEIEATLWKNNIKTLMPITGGDDLVIFLHPNALELVKDILFSIEERLENALEKNQDKKKDKRLKMNFSFLVAKYKFPIYNLFTCSEELLKLTKKEYYKEQSKEKRKTHYGFYWLVEGSAEPGEKDVYETEKFKALLDFARQIHQDKKISTSSIYQILDLLPVIDSPKAKTQGKNNCGQEVPFNLAYHLARNEELAKMLVPKGNEYELKGIEGLKLTRDLWQDVIDMKELFISKNEKEGE